MGIVFVFHGLGAHTEDPGQLLCRKAVCCLFFVSCNQLAGAGYAVFALDYQGHGRSEGERCYIDNLDDYVQDMHVFVTSICLEYPDLYFFLHGISMGGALALLLGLEWQNNRLPCPSKWLGNCMLCPAVMGTNLISPFLLTLLRCCFLPLCPASVPSYITRIPKFRDPKTLDYMLSDKYRWQGVPRYVTADSILRLMEITSSRFGEINFPFILVHGADDPVVPVVGSESIHALSKTVESDKELHIIPEAFHDILNDPSCQLVHHFEISWLNKRIETVKNAK